jgi:hypothetical protein
MKILNKRGEVNLNQWMKMAKGHNGLSWWGSRGVGSQCVHCLNIITYMNKCLYVT